MQNRRNESNGIAHENCSYNATMSYWVVHLCLLQIANHTQQLQVTWSTNHSCIRALEPLSQLPPPQQGTNTFNSLRARVRGQWYCHCNRNDHHKTCVIKRTSVRTCLEDHGSRPTATTSDQWRMHPRQCAFSKTRFELCNELIYPSDAPTCKDLKQSQLQLT